MSTFSHRPSTGQRLLARISSLSLRSDRGSKPSSQGTKKRKQDYPKFETVMEPEEYMLDLGESRTEVRAAPPALGVPKPAERPRTSDCSTLVGVPESPLDNEDYGASPIRYKIMNPDEPTVRLVELDAEPEPQPCNKLWEVLDPQLSETDGTIRLRPTTDDYDIVQGDSLGVQARPRNVEPRQSAAPRFLPPYPMTPPPARVPPPPPPTISTVHHQHLPSVTHASSPIPPSLRPGGPRIELLIPKDEDLSRHPEQSRPFARTSAHAEASTRRPPVPRKPQAYRHSTGQESASSSTLRCPLRTSHPDGRDRHQRPRWDESADDLSRRLVTLRNVSSKRRPRDPRQSHEEPRTHARPGDQTRRAPPVPPKRPSTVVYAGRQAGSGGSESALDDARSGQHKQRHANPEITSPYLEPLVPQVSADTKANDYETLIRGLAGRPAYTSPNAKGSRFRRHADRERSTRSDDYLHPAASASSNRNSRSDVSLGKLEEEIRASCHLPSSKSSEDVQDVLDKAGIPALVRAVAATYPVLTSALVNARNVAAEKDKNVPFSSTLAVVAGPSRERRDSGMAMSLAGDSGAHTSGSTSIKGVDAEVAVPSLGRTLGSSSPPESSLPLERSGSKGKEKVNTVLAIPGSWSFDNVAGSIDGSQAETKTPPPASPPEPTSQSAPNSAIQRTCEACAEELPLTEFPSHALTSACFHENSACRSCVQHWIETQLDDKMWNQITCMQCPEVLTYNDIRVHGTAEALARYDHLAMRALLSEDANFKWCLGPNCESGQVHEGGNAAPLFVCKACGYRFCVIHEEPHEGETCGQYDARLNGEPFEPPEHAEASASAQQALEARRQQEANDLAEAQALRARDERKEAERQSKLREERARVRRARKQALAEQVAADEETARSMQADLNGEPRGKHRTSAWVKQQCDERREQSARDEAVAREYERIDKEQHVREREEAASRQKLRDRMEKKALEQQAKERKALEKAQRAAQLALEEQTRIAAARAREVAAKKAAAAAAQKKAADDLAAKRRRREEEAAGAATVRSVSKQCPSCNWSIQKSSGCNHMRCWKCGHEFCYECLADHKEILRNDNSRHKRSCGYYA